MITDSQTNTLYFADTLQRKFANFYQKIIELLSDNQIEVNILNETKDIWAVDYMPIQVDVNKFIQFTYKPQYLSSKNDLKTISDTDQICKNIELETIKSEIVIDGGNIIKANDMVFLTDRIFIDNPNLEKKILINELRNLFEIEKIFLLPEQPNDFTAHSDGMIRFLDNNTVLINDYKKEKKDFSRAFEIAVHNTSLNYIKVPYNPYNNKNYIQANGSYLNFLQMENLLIIPTFGLKEDDEVVRLFERLFLNQKIVTIDSNEIANKGGILNCISWNIRK